MCLEPLWNAFGEMRHAVGPEPLGISFKLFFQKMCSEFTYTSYVFFFFFLNCQNAFPEIVLKTVNTKPEIQATSHI